MIITFLMSEWSREAGDQPCLPKIWLVCVVARLWLYHPQVCPLSCSCFPSLALGARAGQEWSRKITDTLSLELHNQELLSVLLKKKILSASFSDAALVQPLTCYLTNSVKSWLHCCKNSKACFILVWHIAKNAPEFNTWVFIVMAWISPNHRLINRIRSQTIF